MKNGKSSYGDGGVFILSRVGVEIFSPHTSGKILPDLDNGTTNIITARDKPNRSFGLSLKYKNFVRFHRGLGFPQQAKITISEAVILRKCGYTSYACYSTIQNIIIIMQGLTFGF